ncbi:MAG: hypothetical protein IT204_20050 [Fimbriimonadaceae bacterium]|nr:hypothetical protein [Fimbriimonadaceae bacterium]
MRCWVGLWLLWWSLPAAAAVVGIPLKPDPPFAIDGDLVDWATVPGGQRVATPEQAVWGAAAWTGPADLSADLKLAWRADGLYLAADVTDDQVRQTQRGDGIWKGDHLELYLDCLPDLEPTRQGFGVGQFQLAFSPGNFLTTGDPLTDCRPEAFVYRPGERSAEAIRVAAQRSPSGYRLEALVPFTVLDLDRPSEGQALRYELGVSDTDSPDPKQEALLTTLTTRWEHQRDRLQEAVLAAATGVAAPRPLQFAIRPAVRLQPGQRETVTFDAPAVPPGRVAAIAFRARLDTPRAAGYTQALRLTLNGRPLTGDDFLDRPLRTTSRDGRTVSLAAGETLVVYYSPDFTAPDSHATYGLMEDLKSCEFALRTGAGLRPTGNQLTIEHVQPRVTNELLLADLRLELRLPPPPPKPKAGPPTGELAQITADRVQRTAYTARPTADGQLAVSVNGVTFSVASRFSIPRGTWVTGANEFFDYRREIEQRPEAVVVRETFTNRGTANLGLAQRHEASSAGQPGEFWVGGIRRPQGVSQIAEPQIPTVYLTSGAAGIGLVPLSDVLRVHCLSYADGRAVGLADQHLVLRPGASSTAEWAIVPTARADYWAFLNPARRLLGANFLLDGGFAFLRADPRLTEPWSDEQTANFLRYKDARYVCATIPNIGGAVAHGTLFQQADYEVFKRAFERRRKLQPGVQNLVYYHCFIDATKDAAERFSDSRTLRADGRQADYGQAVYRIFLPLATNSYGPAIARNIDLIFDTIGAEGVYWDEHQYSAYPYHYGQPWDGVTGDLNAKFEISGLKSSVTLLTESWRLQQMRRIQARGPLIGNGAPTTQAVAALRFPCFVETGSITNCTHNQLYSPIALGDHLTERSERDAYRVMLGALDYGCLYHWYNDLTVVPTHHHLTRYMYPIVPVELRAGMVIGEDRVITNRSGLYGFGDAAALEVHVFNDQGVEQPDFVAPVVTRGGQTWAEVRIGEDWSAAILKKR